MKTVHSTFDSITLKMDLQAPLPPPPPPPSNGMVFSNPINHQHQAPINLNTARNLSDRSQLLIDIERGTTLKKVSQSQNGLNSRYMNQIKQISSSNECNGIDNNNYSEDSINPIKNQLQAELSSTLHRRQNGGNKKPNFIVPKNTTINAINNQLRELQNNAQNQPVTNGKTTSDAKQTKPSTDDKDKDDKPKLLISHGKPNFKISSNASSSANSKKLLEKDENVSGNELIGTLRRRLKSVEALDEIEPVEKLNDKPVNEQKFEARVAVADPPTIVRQPKNIVQEQTNVSNGVPKSPVSPPLFYKASVKNFNTVTSNTSSTDGNNEIKRTIRRLKSVELLEQTEKSTDEKTELNDIQRRIQNLKNVEIHKINSSSNGFTSEMRSEEHHKIESITVRSTTETDCFQSSPILPRRAQLFKQQQNLENSKITSPTIHHINHGNSNYKVKPITSFARDLQLTPNRYPDKVAITKTAEPEPVFFSDIKFVINSKGEVVRS